jgi:hypothetical protein
MLGLTRQCQQDFKTFYKWAIVNWLTYIVWFICLDYGKIIEQYVKITLKTAQLIRIL